MNEEKDALLEAFENPDMVKEEKPEEAVTEVAPAAEVTPAAEVEPAPVEAPVEAQAETPVEAPVETVEPTEVKEKKTTKKSGKADAADPSLKKNMTFIFILFALIAAFIIFLPTILSLLNGGSY